MYVYSYVYIHVCIQCVRTSLVCVEARLAGLWLKVGVFPRLESIHFYCIFMDVKGQPADFSSIFLFFYFVCFHSAGTNNHGAFCWIHHLDFFFHLRPPIYFPVHKQRRGMHKHTFVYMYIWKINACICTCVHIHTSMNSKTKLIYMYACAPSTQAIRSTVSVVFVLGIDEQSQR